MTGTKDDRQNLRVPVNLRVRIATGDERDLKEAYSRNLSESGMFIQTAEPAEKGQRVKFEILLGTKNGEKVMRGTGEVVWTRTTRDAMEQVRPPGMGIRFRMLDDASKLLVKSVVEKYLAEHSADDASGGAEARRTRDIRQKAKERRIAPRATAGMSVLFRLEGEPTPKHGHVINISSTGVFIRTKEPGPYGAKINFEIQLPNTLGEVVGSGTIAWRATTAFPSESPRIPGMGVEFSRLSEESRQLLDRALADHLLGELADSSSRAFFEPEDDEEPTEESAGVESEQKGTGKKVEIGKPAQREQPADIALSIQMELQPEPGGRAAALDGLALRKWVVNSLVAAVEIARLPEFAHTETIQYLLISWCQDFLNGRTVDLTMYWNMLLSETGVSVEEAALPVSIFHAARHDHGIGMLMPEGFESLSNLKKIQAKAENLLKASKGFVDVVHELAARPVEGMDERIVAYERHVHAPTKNKKASMKARGKQNLGGHVRRWKLIIALLAMGLAFGVTAAVALSVYQAKAADIDLSDYEQVLVLENGLQKGDTINAFVADPRWKDMTEAERRDVVVDLSDRLALEGIRRITLFDDTGVVCVAVAPSDKGDRVILLGQEVYDQQQQGQSASK